MKTQKKGIEWFPLRWEMITHHHHGNLKLRKVVSSASPYLFCTPLGKPHLPGTLCNTCTKWANGSLVKEVAKCFIIRLVTHMNRLMIVFNYHPVAPFSMVPCWWINPFLRPHLWLKLWGSEDLDGSSLLIKFEVYLNTLGYISKLLLFRLFPS